MPKVFINLDQRFNTVNISSMKNICVVSRGGVPVPMQRSSTDLVVKHPAVAYFAARVPREGSRWGVWKGEAQICWAAKVEQQNWKATVTLGMLGVVVVAISPVRNKRKWLMV